MLHFNNNGNGNGKDDHPSKQKKILSKFPKIHVFRLNNNKPRYPTPKQSVNLIENRCRTKIVENLPVELLIEIFGFVLEPNRLRVWKDDKYNIETYDWLAPEDQRKFMRLTCKKWNAIILGLLTEMDIDLSRVKSSTLEGSILHPPVLKRLRIFSGRYNARRIQVDQWLNKSNLSQLQSLTFEGCSELTINAILFRLTNINNRLNKLEILNCSHITQSSLVSLFSRLHHLSYLTLNTEQFFLDPTLAQSIELQIPRLETLSILISYKNFRARDSDQDGKTTIVQFINKMSFPGQIKELILGQDLPEYSNHILTSYDYDRMGPISDYPGITHQLGFQSAQNPYPTLKKLDVSQCSFVNHLFVVPQTLTHLTVSYPSLPMDHLDAKLPSTIEYLKISGFVYHTAFERDSQIMYHSYGERWVHLLPDHAPSLHTLILHVYVLSPKNLYTAISSRYSTSLRHLDLCVFFTIITGLGDLCSCNDVICSLGQCHRRNLIRSLTSIRELKLHNRVDEQDMDSLPDSLRQLWLYNGYKDHVPKSAMDNKKGFIINELPKGVFGCSESKGRCSCMLLRSGSNSGYYNILN